MTGRSAPPTRLERIDAAAGAAADAYVRTLLRVGRCLARLACGALALVAVLLVLRLLSWGSELEDWVPWMEVQVSTEPRSGCPSTAVSALGSDATVYIGPTGQEEC